MRQFHDGRRLGRRLEHARLKVGEAGARRVLRGLAVLGSNPHPSHVGALALGHRPRPAADIAQRRLANREGQSDFASRRRLGEQRGEVKRAVQVGWMNTRAFLVRSAAQLANGNAHVTRGASRCECAILRAVLEADRAKA
eukprot:scaffold36275_cov154-Isochrysis_galbana.AAC.42